MRYLLAVAVVASIALGQEAGRAVISGTVVDASTGEPIRKAIVTLTLQGAPRRWATARTDSSGQFTFAGLPAGKYDLGATMQGVVAAWGPDVTLLRQDGYVVPRIYAGRFYGTTGAGKAPEPIAIEEGEIRGGLKLLFIHPGSITGHVFEPDGHPAANVIVTVLSGKRAQVNLRSDITDDSGEYQFIGLDPGDYYLLATPQNQGARSQSGNGLLTPQYYGGSREWKDSTVLHVRGGENLTAADFPLHAEPPHTIHGHLTGVPVLPPEHEEVLVRLGGQVYLAHGPDYSFDFSSLLEGVYRVEARVEAGGQVWAVSQPVDTRTAGDDVILPLAPPIDIKGQLRIEGEAERAKSDLEVRLVRENSPENFKDAPIAGRPGADGGFILKQVPAGEWVLNVDKLPAGAFLKSASLGDQDVRFKAFTVGMGSTGPLNIVISTRTAQLAGEIEAGSGDPKRAGIVLAPIGPFHDLERFYYVAVSDDSGKFQFAHVAPGKYRIFALENMAPQPFRNPDAADQLGVLGTEIELTEGAESTVHPKLILAERAREVLNSEVRQ
jgi:Carboxypeptidase regulatory-like domain